MHRIIAVLSVLVLFAAQAFAQPVVELKVYPAATPTGSQRTNDAAVPLAWARAHLDRLERETPEAERSTLEVRGWTGVQVWRRHTLTPAEVAEQRIAELERRQRLVLSELERGADLTPERRRQLVDLLRE